MKDPTAILLAARTLIAEPGCWTRQAMARKKDGALVYVDDPEASQWCAEGAIRLVSPDAALEIEACRFLDIGMGRLITTYNDTHGHAKVLAAFDRAIELSEEGAQ